MKQACVGHGAGLESSAASVKDPSRMECRIARRLSAQTQLIHKMHVMGTMPGRR
jgi:hypothetical protein